MLYSTAYRATSACRAGRFDIAILQADFSLYRYANR